MSCWKKDKFKQLYKQPKPGEVFMDSQDTEDSGGRVREVRKVDTDDLGFSWPHGTGGSPPKKKANVCRSPCTRRALFRRRPLHRSS